MHERRFLPESQGFVSYFDKLFIRTWTSSSLISVLAHMVRGKEKQGPPEGVGAKERVKVWGRHRKLCCSCPSNYSQSKTIFASGMMHLINVIKSQMQLLSRPWKPMNSPIHNNHWLSQMRPQWFAGGVLAVSKRLNQANDTMRSLVRWLSSVIVTTEQIPHSFCLGHHYMALTTACKRKFLNLHHHCVIVTH